MNTERLNQIKDEVAKERGRKTFYTFLCIALEPSKQIEAIDEVAKRYACECVKASLDKAAEGFTRIVHDKIIDESNIVLL